MNDQQQELFEQKMEDRMARGFLYIGSIAKFRENVQLFIDGFSGGRVSDSAFEIVEKSMVEAGELRPIVVKEEPELTAKEYHSMSAGHIKFKYQNDPAFKAGVDNLIAKGAI